MKAALKALLFLYICVNCSASHAQDPHALKTPALNKCSEIFSLHAPLFESFTYHVFDGYPRDSSTTAEKLNYPKNWIYRKMGGLSEDVQFGERLVGMTSKTYLAQKENGGLVILKEYGKILDLERDLRAYEHLGTLLKSGSPRQVQSRFLSPKVIRSRRNPFVLELEYFSGVDFATFLANNKNNISLYTLIEQYNRSASQLSANLSSEYWDPQTAVDSSELKRVIFGDVKDVFIWLHPANVLVVRSTSQASGFDFVIIDPE